MKSSLGLGIFLAGLLATSTVNAGKDTVQYLDSGTILPQGLPFSEAVRVGNTMYLSGMIGIRPGTLQRVPDGLALGARPELECIAVFDE